jgi:hypothetical protein
MGVLAKWHDSAGFGIFLLSFVCLWAAAGLVARRWARPTTPPVDGSRANSRCDPFRLLPRRYLAIVGCWMIGVLGLTELWYRVHDTPPGESYRWAARMPTGNPTFQTVPLPPRTVKLLACDWAQTGRWRDDDGAEWTLNFFRWKPRSVQSVIHARLHRPEICLPASGLRQVSVSKPVRLQAGHLELPFRECTYEAQGRDFYVFFCQWEDGAEKQSGMAASKAADRLQAVLTGRRWLGQQTLELTATGFPSLDGARERLRHILPSLIQTE